MRFVKIFGWSLLVVARFLAIGIVVGLLCFDPNDHKGEIERAFREKTGRELKLHGELDLKLFPWLALRLESAELGNAPGFGTVAFAVIEEADLGVKTWP